MFAMRQCRQALSVTGTPVTSGEETFGVRWHLSICRTPSRGLSVGFGLPTVSADRAAGEEVLSGRAPLAKAAPADLITASAYALAREHFFRFRQLIQPNIIWNWWTREVLVLVWDIRNINRIAIFKIAPETTSHSCILSNSTNAGSRHAPISRPTFAFAGGPP